MPPMNARVSQTMPPFPMSTAASQPSSLPSEDDTVRSLFRLGGKKVELTGMSATAVGDPDASIRRELGCRNTTSSSSSSQAAVEAKDSHRLPLFMCLYSRSIFFLAFRTFLASDL